MVLGKYIDKKIERREEELKCVNINMKKLGGSNKKLIISKSEKEVDQTTEDQLTPRLENPVSILRRKNSSEVFDEIPNERMEPIRLIPLLNVTKVLKMSTRRNMTQLIVHNKSGCIFITPSLLSHE